MTDIQKYVLPYFKSPGIFIEIGCWDGEHKSQTAALERLGWKGVCVDPYPINFENRRCQVIKSAISKDGVPREFIKVTKDRRHGGDVSYFSGFKDSVDFHWPVISEHCDYEIEIVKTATFAGLVWLCELPHHIQFLSVDTEGSELEIFQSIDFKKYRFDMIMFEHNGVENGVGKLLKSKGYQLYKRLELDDIYVNQNLN